MTTRISLIGLLFVLFIGCAEKPKTIGGNLIDPDNIFSTDTSTVYSLRDTAFTSILIPGFGSSNLAGRIFLDEEAVSFLKFIPSVALDSLAGASIDTAEIRLIVNYRMNAASVPVEFDVFETLEPWAQSGLNKDSSASTAIGSTLLGTFSDSMNAGQTVAALIDTGAVRRWIVSYADTSTADFNGFAVRPKAGMIPGIIGFGTFSDAYGYYPEMVVKYTTRFGTHDSIVVNNGEDTFVGRVASNPPGFQIRGGFGIRSKILFSVDTLEKIRSQRPGSILMLHKATLTLVSDTTASLKSGYAPDTALVFLGVTGTTMVDSFSTASFAYGLHSTDASGNSIYQFDINVIAQSWLNNVNANDGLILRWGSETSTAEKIVFYRSTDPDPAKRPRIKFMYSYK